MSTVPPPVFPDEELLFQQAVKITDDELPAVIYGNLAAGLPYTGTTIAAWAVNFLAEHYRALVAGVTPDESLWPDVFKNRRAGLKKAAEDFNAGVASGSVDGAVPIPKYPYTSKDGAP